MKSLDAELRRLARLPSLLVAADFDGTLADIVSRPHEAEPVPGVGEALSGLARFRGVTVAVISGRSRDDLLDRLGDLPGVLAVGGHGSEWPGEPIDPAVDALRRTVADDLGAIAETAAGAMVETKPYSVAFHYRGVPEERRSELVRRVKEGPARRPGVRLVPGKMVLELSLSSISKGDAVERLRRQAAADGVLFVGDDLTDESVFDRLEEWDVGVKVGDGATAARHRVSGPAAVVGLLGRLGHLRRP